MWAHLKKWWATEGAMVQLRGLDDRLLADMGLEREGLQERVRGKEDAPNPVLVGGAPAVACGRC